MGRFRAISLCVVPAVFSAASAAGHDLPLSAHPATAETLNVEELLASQPPDARSNFKLFSFVAKNLLWGSSTVFVCFWNGSRERRAHVASLADNIAALTPVRFSWGPNGTFTTCPQQDYQVYPVRVSLIADTSLLATGDNSADYFASIGRLNESAPRRATVNLPFSATTTQDEIKAKTRHEFCHVLGCLHEHQRGLCDNDFKKDWIKARYNLNDAQYEANFLQIPTSDVSYGAQAFGGFDRDSIMLYSIPLEAFSNQASQCYRAAQVTDLSPADSNGLRQAYARPSDPRLSSTADFNRLAAAAEELALRKRSQSALFRSSARQWQLSALGDESTRSQAVFERLAQSAEAAATQAEEEAEGFRLTPLAQQRLEAFLASLPPGN
jgi:hypothetical protein